MTVSHMFCRHENPLPNPRYLVAGDLIQVLNTENSEHRHMRKLIAALAAKGPTVQAAKKVIRPHIWVDQPRTGNNITNKII